MDSAMKPVAIFRFSSTEGPGYLADFLSGRNIPWQVIAIDRGEALPPDISAFSGIAMMGGPMSVNDLLDWIPPMLTLIRQAHSRDIPMIGHCLGGQLMSRAFGGTVVDNACHEVGWHEVEVLHPELAHEWFGETSAFLTFQWHYQTFSIPAGATRVLRNGYCENQAYVMGKHIGFQCHIEMTQALVKSWCEQSGEEIGALPPAPSVQGVSRMLENLDEKVAGLNRVAGRIYSHWITGLKA